MLTSQQNQKNITNLVLAQKIHSLNYYFCNNKLGLSTSIICLILFVPFRASVKEPLTTYDLSMVFLHRFMFTLSSQYEPPTVNYVLLT